MSVGDCADVGCSDAPLTGPGHGERGRADDAVVLEVQVQVVAAGAGDLGIEDDVGTGLGRPVAGAPVGVDVQVGQVARAQRYQVPVGAEVGLAGR